MKKLKNAPDQLVEECLKGYVAAHKEIIELEGDHLVVRKKKKGQRPGEVCAGERRWP